MRRTWLVSALTLSVASLIATTYLLLLSPTAFAATGTASCGGGKTVSCSAYHCDCFDGSGCVATDSSGNDTLITCPGKTIDRDIADELYLNL